MQFSTPNFWLISDINQIGNDKWYIMVSLTNVWDISGVGSNLGGRTLESSVFWHFQSPKDFVHFQNWGAALNHPQNNLLISINPQIGQVVAALFATELFHVHFCAKSSGIQGRVKFEISTHFSVPKWKKWGQRKTRACTRTWPGACIHICFYENIHLS